LWLCIVAAVVAAGTHDAQTQTISESGTPLTNAAQIAALMDQPDLAYPLVTMSEPTQFIPTDDTLWVDFEQLTNGIGDVRNYWGTTDQGIALWPLRIIRSATGTSI